MDIDEDMLAAAARIHDYVDGWSRGAAVSHISHELAAIKRDAENDALERAAKAAETAKGYPTDASEAIRAMKRKN